MRVVTLGELLTYQQPTKYIVKNTSYVDSGTRVLTPGKSFTLGYTDEKDGIYRASVHNPVIIFDDFTAAYKWVDFPFKVKSSASKILSTSSSMATIRYLYHMMGKIGFSSSEHKRLWISTYSKFTILLPPIDVQSAIVRLLDEFYCLCNSLSDEIPAEIRARQKQYEYFRDKLLSFGEV